MGYRKYIEKWPMPSRQAMRKLLRKTVKFSLQTEKIALSDALNRIATIDVKTRRVLPNGPVGRMDGIGVRGKDFMHGLPDTNTWKKGREYVFVNTGCSITAPYDTLILIEDIEFIEGRLCIKTLPQVGQLVDQPGSILQKEELILRQYQRITPVLMGLLAAGGINKISVLKKPKVIFIPTGDELVPWQTPKLQSGKNIESNSMMIYGFLQQYQAETVIFPIIRDNKEALKDALRQAAMQADIILINAGSSKGTKDFTLDILENEGNVLVYELGCRPGKHSSFAFFQGKPVLGMAGPPNGTELAARFYLKTLLNIYYHQLDPMPVTITVEAEFSFKAVDEFDYCIQVHIYSKRNICYAKMLNPKAITRAHFLQECNAFVYLPAGKKIDSGDQLVAELLIGRESIDIN
jgi:molybdopterin molybdotransferase